MATKNKSTWMARLKAFLTRPIDPFTPAKEKLDLSAGVELKIGDKAVPFACVSEGEVPPQGTTELQIRLCMPYDILRIEYSQMFEVEFEDENSCIQALLDDYREHPIEAIEYYLSIGKYLMGTKVAFPPGPPIAPVEPAAEPEPAEEAAEIALQKYIWYRLDSATVEESLLLLTGAAALVD